VTRPNEGATDAVAAAASSCLGGCGTTLLIIVLIVLPILFLIGLAIGPKG
jgi:hypothetical protein